MIRKLDIIPIFQKRKYFCSENSLATLLNYYNIKETPISLFNKGCFDIYSLENCIPKGFQLKTTTISEIKRSINSDNPIIVSVIPDSNLEKMEKHSILIYGYSDKNLLTIDNGKKTRISYDSFKKIWKRTKNLAWIK